MKNYSQSHEGQITLRPLDQYTGKGERTIEVATLRNNNSPAACSASKYHRAEDIFARDESGQHASRIIRVSTQPGVTPFCSSPRDGTVSVLQCRCRRYNVGKRPPFYRRLYKTSSRQRFKRSRVTSHSQQTSQCLNNLRAPMSGANVPQSENCQ